MIDDPKHKHLAKAKPPALNNRGAGGPEFGDTDPNLRKYQDRRSGGGGAMKVLLGIVIVVIFSIVLILFVRPIRDAVRPFFPAGIQRLLMDEPESAPIPASTTEPTAAPAATPETKAP